MTTTTKAVLGVDPGVEGGMTLLGSNGQPMSVQAIHSKMTEFELTLIVTGIVLLLKNQNSDVCYFENVGYMPGDGGLGVFTFGRITGFLRGALHANGIRPTYVSPQIWQARLECLTRGNKNVSKNKAKELFPTVKWTHNTADSALIAEYGRRQLALWD